MFIALGIAEYDATVVEVEGGAAACVVLDGVPGLPVAPDAFDDDDGLLVAVGVEGIKGVFYLDMSQLKWFVAKVGNDACRTASCLEPGQIVVSEYRSWLAPVGHAKIEFPEFALQPTGCLQLLVGIISIVRVDHRSYKVEVGGRLDAKSLAFVDAAQPYEESREWSHSCQYSI